MDKPKDGKDPVEKLKQLQTWLKENRVPCVSAAKLQQPGVVEKDTKDSAAQKEVEDFKDWLRDIQSPDKPLFGSNVVSQIP